MHANMPLKVPEYALKTLKYALKKLKYSLNWTSWIPFNFKNFECGKLKKMFWSYTLISFQNHGLFKKHLSVKEKKLLLFQMFQKFFGETQSF